MRGLEKGNLIIIFVENFDLFYKYKENYKSESQLLSTKCLKLIKNKIFSLRVFVLFKMCCKSRKVSVKNKLSTRLKTSISIGIL